MYKYRNHVNDVVIEGGNRRDNLNYQVTYLDHIYS